MRSFLPIAFIGLILSGCWTRKPSVHDVRVKSNFELDGKDTFIEIQKLVLQSDSLAMTVQYKGGCKNDHHFECVYDPEINSSSDTVKLILVHYSDDQCFSILKKDLHFYLEPGFIKKDSQYLRLNTHTIPVL